MVSKFSHCFLVLAFLTILNPCSSTDSVDDEEESGSSDLIKYSPEEKIALVKVRLRFTVICPIQFGKTILTYLYA
jgi:hypothetical protein